MRLLILALGLWALIAVPSIADAKCFLFFCSPRPHVTRHHAPRSACNKILVARAAETNVSQDTFVKSFPPAKQKRVLSCLAGEDND
jgi:hypothetical protein